ncbi:tRNA-uridine aminocarboxypropyltransferase 1 [Carcharodon carcharias]|uniref:tRNA-uridine aminocarboxypropyltransferase 1 n=1 Tax=Carcharodon carcharias TaxID=13397 RepID=UPI001B7EB1CF|nr:tRNA-uridine aminocarboxypropyltransferase 1 [Carcharodon carcharias]XP_041031240.1 tRNA-uridine aminocarboxypropyltransferase 1 [Carcharodon carcharias]XP_041031241.1 tRNA-uridine aminocarboxypropyltransferase 1 [Carcharodon carcharias]XP_041031242.1 tRNA-uridine aminocarboxypropyltransferase 1 [Carcharodon carcharias]XP_041031243.1 tRNA-uridine aminocarboxypropyltransferase 1 [Carcharodon carcharias]XP_041031244.1 tRNA-uridine aminocarboxypropyltransferase 1 [Carcharodon carcharias]
MSVSLERTMRVEDALHTDASKCESSDRLCTQSSEADKQEVSDSFKDLKLASQTILETLQQNGRSKCPKCQSSRMFYCYSCCLLVDGVNSDEIPQVKLPLKIDIIKHPNETDGKSTAVHAKLLARDDVNIYTYPCMPDNEEEKHEVVVVFPGPKSISLEDLPKHLSNIADKKSVPTRPSKNVHSHDENIPLEGPELKRAKLDHCSLDTQNPTEEQDAGEVKIKMAPLKRVIFIDSTWNQTNKIITDERLQELLHVELRTRKTHFWRRQKGKPDTYLATIEAIYYFLVDYHRLLLKENYNGEYDNLFFFYSFMYRLINKAKHAAGKLN